MKPICSQANVPPKNGPVTKTLIAIMPAIHALDDFQSCRMKTAKQTAATNTTMPQAIGVFRSHGDTTSAQLAAKPEDNRSADVQFLAQSGQKTKNGVTSSSCPFNIAPRASKQPQQNQRFVEAASAANKKKGNI